MDKGAAPAAWAIVLLVPPPPQGLPGQCNRHKCERERQSLLFDQRPPPTHWPRRAPCQMRLSDFSPVQAAQVWTGRAVSAIRSKTTAHSLAEKSSLPDATCLCRQIAVTGVAPAAWAIVLLVPPPPQGSPGRCKRHRCGREGQSLIFDQRPPPTHWSRRAPCQLRLSDFSPVHAAQVCTGRAVSAIRSNTTAHSLAEKSSLPYATCLCRQIAVTVLH